MKNLLTFILALSTLPIFSQNYTPRGTGRTTGHIITLSVSNPSEEPMTAFVPKDGNINHISVNNIPIFQKNDHRGSLFFIPSTHRFQSYVATSASPPPGISAGNISIPPGDTLHIAVHGYCADIHSPPIPGGQDAPPISSWIGGNGNIPPPASGIPAGFAPTRNPESMPFAAANVPNQFPSKPLTTSLDKNPDAPEYLFHAIREIIDSYDNLQADGLISTPFSTNPEKQRESVIQQTFWIYTASLTGNPYVKEDFRDRMIAQYENSSDTEIENAPPEVVEKIDEGVDDFWNTFTAVGMEAKVLSTNDSYPHKDEMEDEFGNADVSNVNPKTGTAADQAADEMGAAATAVGADVHHDSNPDQATAASEVAHAAQDSLQPKQGPAASGTAENKKCECGDISAEISLPDLQPGKPARTVKAATGSDRPVPVEFKVRRDQIARNNTLKLNIENIVLSCTCEGAPCPVQSIPASLYGALAGNSTKDDSAPKYEVKIRRTSPPMRLVGDQVSEKKSKDSVEYEFQRPNLQDLRLRHIITLEIQASCATENCNEAKCMGVLDIVLDIE